MKKRGFTLAETIIILGIVGVIAALTISPLTSNVKEKIWANSLAATISDIENALGAYMIKKGTLDLAETEVWQDINDSSGKCLDSNSSLETKEYFSTNIPYFKTPIDKSMKEYYENKLYSIDKEIADDELNLKHAIYELKKGSSVFVRIMLGQEHGKEDLLYSRNAGNIIIDINGQKAPNTIGRDVFYFILGNNGKLYPYGGKDYAILMNKPQEYLWKNKCSDSDKGNGSFCTARLIENKYKMDY